ncbi:MAG: hypothetical protein ABEL76_00805, partial [Bradymonadaceae bacterium]
MEATAECLHEELQRLLDENQGGNWEIQNRTERMVRLCHSTNPTRYLYVEMLPNYSITLQTRRREKAKFEKMLVPFGAPVEQVYNLLDVASRDIYYRHFDDPSRYLGDKRRLRETVTPKKREHREVFEFLRERCFELKVMLTLSEHAWNATHDAIEAAKEAEDAAAESAD